MKEILKDGFSKMNIAFDDSMCEKLVKYKDILIEANKNMNLTAITEPNEIAVKHFLDSASLLSVLDIPAGARVIDVGTGAGFPGMVLKILRPDISLTLLDAQKKRVEFLKECGAALGLEGIQYIHARAEDAAKKEGMRESYHLCTSRAVAKMSTLSEYCLPLTAVGGVFAALKGPAAAQEINDAQNAIKTLGGGSVRLENILLPSSDLSHTVVLVDKTFPTPTKYPRSGNKPSSNPL